MSRWSTAARVRTARWSPRASASTARFRTGSRPERRLATPRKQKRPGRTGPRGIAAKYASVGRLAADFLPDLALVRRLADSGEADDDADRRNRHRIEQADERHAGQRRGERIADERHAAAEDAVAHVVG